uniref:Uncharacterized protein n=1 Tax=viral metagenome TaxID=1070528 RepID=A0A6H1ZP49_9ZZZZ
MTTFVMKGYNGKTVRCAMSHTPLKITGNFYCQGRQPVDDDGAPQWVYDLLENNPDIEQVGIVTKKSGRVYSR